MLRPVSESGRLTALDTLRGGAILGILIVNVNQLFEPVWIADTPTGLVPDQPSAGILWLLTDALVNNKFLTLFSLLFGTGFALQWSRQGHGDSQFGHFYRRRLAWLGVFGLMHALLLYMADVLVIYALAGALLYLLRDLSGRTLVLTGVALWLLTLAWQNQLHQPEEDAPPPAEQHRVLVETIGGEEPAAGGKAERRLAWPVPLHRARDIFLSGSELERAQLEYFAFARGPVELTLLQRASFFALLMLYTLLYLLWRTLAVFMIAAGLVKLGVLEPRMRSRWRQAAAIALSLGLPLAVLATALRSAAYRLPGGESWLGNTLHELSSLLLAGGLAATVLVWCTRPRAVRLQRAFAAVGRTALSNYLGQSVIVSSIACWYGLGLYGELTRAQQLGLAFALFGLQVVLSRLWLSRYEMGPLEWIWRRLTYGRSLPLRRSAVALHD